MPEDKEKKLKKIIKEIVKLARAKGVDDPALLKFIKLFFAEAVYDDLAAYRTDNLLQMVLGIWSFSEKRPHGKANIRIIEPASEQLANISIIEICCEDMPFLVDSVMAEISDGGHEVHLILHPILNIERDAKGLRSTVHKHQNEHSLCESLIHIHIRRIPHEADRRALVDRLGKILADVRIVVLDWPLMRERLGGIIASFQSSPPPVPVDELAETIQFLQWLNDDNFLFLGIREFFLVDEDETSVLEEVKGTGLGILRDREVKVLRRGRELMVLTPEVREFLMQPAPLIITKANVRATVHRHVHMDYIGIKQFDADGHLTGELRVVGLFTASAYTRSIRSIPFLRRKAELVMRRSGHSRTSHSGRAIMNVLNSYPRDELFQIETEKLFEFVIGILQLYERPRTRAFIRRDKFDRFVSALIYVPKDAYNTSLRLKIGDILTTAYEGSVSAFYPAFPEGPLARVHFIIGRYHGETPSPDKDEIEACIARAARSWEDNLFGAMLRLKKPVSTARYKDAFSKAYQNTFETDDALYDIGLMEKLGRERALVIDFYHREEYGENGLRLKMFHMDSPIALSDRLPILENMGFRSIAERTYPITRNVDDTRQTIWYHSISIETADGAPVRKDILDHLAKEAFMAIWTGKAEDDAHNTLNTLAGMSWRNIAVLRACTHYLKQAGVAFSRSYMARTLCNHSDFAGLLMEIFSTRFDPQSGLDKSAREKKSERLRAKFEKRLEGVESLDEDRVLRLYLDLVFAFLRTNAYMHSAANGPGALAFKVNSSQLEQLPKPKPFAEIFVCSPRVQGVHLRGGAIARGGIRWSDRQEDFRTEVLGLMKAQQVKNAVIVPVGSKGGFVPRRISPTASRAEFISEGTACYKIFINEMLRITDNLDGTRVLPPADIVRYDGDDPYLVVAADKGTATFSDTANEIAISRNFWLGDAFASGGSVGYDHKKMGITARGGWEAVKRHFREMDINIQTTPFTVIGVGDMSGDVFGNGMLLSPEIKLVAAFDHRDIFIDPEPDIESSFAERKRLFELPRSTWRDYNKELISKGGGIFSRKLKSIPLNDTIKKLVDLDRDKVTPGELIHAILKAKADLMWFGGIGTYVRASEESDVDVGDRVNDPVRITGSELRVKVIGEGANLGVTQRGRIEFACAGGRINTDAIDNSAGVNTSDIEVNIKIALKGAIACNRLKSADRPALLAKMTDEVGLLALANNYSQSLAISLDQARGCDETGAQIRLMAQLEAAGELDRALEFLPDDLTMRQYQKQGRALTRPELAVILAYAKISLFNDLLDDPLVDDAYFTDELMGYFPKTMHELAAEDIQGHKLRREIISTLLSNDMVNRSGSAFASQMSDETGLGSGAVARAHIMARDVFRLPELGASVDRLDNKVPVAFQGKLYLNVQNLLRRHTLWFLRNGSGIEDLHDTVTGYRKIIDNFIIRLEELLDADAWHGITNEKNRFMHQNLAEHDAMRFACLPLLNDALDIIRAAENTGHSANDAASIYFAVGQELGLKKLLENADAVTPGNYFDALAFSRVIGDTGVAQRRLTQMILTGKGSWREQLDAWLEQNSNAVQRTATAISDLAASGPLTLARLTVANGYVSDLVI